MASVQENIATARRGYDAFSSGDMQTLAEVIAEDVVWHGAGRGRFAGDKQGRDATFAYFGQLGELSGGTFRVDLHDLAGSDEHIIGVQTVTGERAGRSLNLREALVFHLRDGRIVEAWENLSDTQAWDEFFA